jgi:hypothetical protein
MGHWYWWAVHLIEVFGLFLCLMVWHIPIVEFYTSKSALMCICILKACFLEKAWIFVLRGMTSVVLLRWVVGVLSWSASARLLFGPDIGQDILLLFVLECECRTSVSLQHIYLLLHCRIDFKFARNKIIKKHISLVWEYGCLSELITFHCVASGSVI